MKWDKILRRLENLLVVNEEEIHKGLPKSLTGKMTFQRQINRRDKIMAAIRYVKKNRGSYPIRRVETKFKLIVR